MGDPTEFERGVIAGAIETRLAGHDRHFASINGSLERISHEMHALTLAVQRLADQAEADAKKVVATAAALKEAEEARRQNSAQRFTPWQRGIAIVGGLLAVLAVIAAIRGWR